MGLTAKEGGSGKKFDPVDEGLHQAICYAVYDLGTHQETIRTKDRGVVVKDIHKVLLMWELPHERMDYEKDGQTKNVPRVVSERYTLSLGEKANLRKFLETWRGRTFTEEERLGFDIDKLLGVGCQLQIMHTHKGENTYANVKAIVPWPKGIPPMRAETPLVYYGIGDHGTNLPEGIPKWIKELIQSSDEWKALTGTGADEPPPAPFDDSDVPF